MKNAIDFSGITALGLIILVAASVTATEGVSPGAIDGMAQVNNACPTFSWDGEAGAVMNELVAYELPQGDEAAGVELTADAEVLYARVPGGASSWTPSADQCFAPGGRYVWFVRAVNELAGDEVVEAGEWSAGRYFTVPAAPSEEEVARAIEVMRWLEAGGQGAGGGVASLGRWPSDAGTGTVHRTGAGAGAGGGASHRKSVPTASAAIRGEHPDTLGEAYGVVGMSSSHEGAGIAAANLDGGPDLVLDGSVDGEVDTILYEWGMYRTSAADESFSFQNPGAGRLDVTVDGDMTSDVVRTEEVVVNGMTVIDDSGDWLGNGSTVPCPGCVTSSDIANLSITGADLADDSVSGAKIADGAVGGTHLVTGAVSSVKILDGTIAAADLADGSVTGAKIGAGAVSSTKLGNNAVTTDKIADGTITAADVDATSSIYVSKSQLYEREEAVTLTIVATLPASVYCDDANDLPLAGSCVINGTGGLTVRATQALDWVETSNPAGWECLFYNQTGGSHTGRSRILCISVP